MNRDQITKRYAQAILGVASEKKEEDKFEQELSLFEEIIKENSDFSAFLNSKLIQAEDKIKVLNDVFGKDFSPEIMNFLSIICEKNREEYIVEISAKYREIANEYRGIALLDCYSAVEVNEKQKEELMVKLSEVLGKKIKLSMNIDETLLGGLQVKYKDQIIDGSVINRLGQYKKVLTK